MSINEISIVKAAVHNLKNVSINIPKNTLTVITGPSGSGKSSLAFDTIYVEGQRRYIESLSSYARQFLGQYQPPEVESITGLSPAIAIDQKTSNKNPRSTVGTTTEIYDYLRVLFARIGTLYDPETGKEVRRYTPTQIVKEILKSGDKAKLQILAPIPYNDKIKFKELSSKFQTMGFTRARLDGEMILLDETNKPSKGSYQLDIIVDRIVIKDDIEKRLADSVEYALKLAEGNIQVLVDDKKTLNFSEHNKSTDGSKIFPELEPRLFSFNSPIGACEVCNGLGETKIFDIDLMVFDENLPLLEGAITPLSKRNSFLYKMVETIANDEGVDISGPFKKLPKKLTNILFNGTDKVYRYSFTSENSHFEFSKAFPGMSAWLEKKYLESGSDKVRIELEKYMNIKTCPTCNGLRLNRIALATKIGDRNIMDLCTLSIGECFTYLTAIKLEGEKKIIAEKLLKEIVSRLRFLNDVGLNYLTLNRGAVTLSGGESQRIRLATQIGSALSGVLYVLDEPSIGLHQRDNDRLIKTLKTLRDLGNTVLVVEHDEDTMNASDYIIDMGPGAGIHGGMIVAHGTLEKILSDKKSLTAKFLSGVDRIPVPKTRKKATKFLKLTGATEHNINKLDVTIPLGGLVCISGVSGSGKSTLIHKVLVPALKTHLTNTHKTLYSKTNYNALAGVDEIKTVIELDQSPIGRTPHSNPATYTGLFDEIRDIFASTNESQIRGYKTGRFSFNVKGGRCEECEGNGVKKIEMHFLPDVYITCVECKGTRYNAETLSVLYKGKNISEILDLSIEEGCEFFKNHTKISRVLETLNAVGLGYMKLGQPATTLSGGEAQRLKLSRELSKRTKGHCLYVLDEPTTGLHFQDIKILLLALQKLVEQGHTLLIIEHNLDVIKTADYVIDLGPEGGSGGGEVVAIGTPEEISKNPRSITGKYLKKVLKL
ncbi:MAG: excinuclease ABC subunit UvrA [Bacteriovoracaceae bacterium]|nr:excinuclease ABC subunit UvrA [Bacteriovoracaceae bacterium]